MSATAGSIDDILADKSIRFVFVGGKGGVGKTTSSSAIAAQLSYDRKVLLISTDPAHSLSDAFLQQFSSKPTTIKGLPNLDVMEVNPEEFLTMEVGDWAEMADSAGLGDWSESVKDFQDWLCGIPGIDEATALSSVIDLIESGTYDVIVFDTAPTGHTLKLMQLPGVLQLGIEKLQSVQSQLWTAWNSFESLTTGNRKSAKRNALKRTLERKLVEYKTGVEKVGMMMQDQMRTRFMVVCIAEYLSISESQRLLQELARNGVRASHVCVNQLVTAGPSAQEREALDAHAAAHPDLEAVWTHTRSALDLCSARRSIQQKYLAMFAAFPEVRPLTMVELPLLPTEVTGPQTLLEFSQLFVTAARGKPELLANRKVEQTKLYTECEGVLPPNFDIDDRVTIKGLTSSAKYNGLLGTVKELKGTRIIVVADLEDGSKKKLLLKEENLEHADEDEPMVCCAHEAVPNGVEVPTVPVTGYAAPGPVKGA